MPPEPSIARLWVDELLGAMDDHGRSMRVNSLETRRQLEAVGFVDVQEEIIKIPYSGWPLALEDRNIGRWFNLGVTVGLMALTLAPLTRMRDKTKDEVKRLVDDVKKEICNRDYHLYCHM